MFTALEANDRQRLLRFVGAFAWADLEVDSKERDMVARLLRALAVEPHDNAAVDSLLAHPPRPEDVDPQDIPAEHRTLFLLAAKAVIAADGVLSEGELDLMDLFEQLLA